MKINLIYFISYTIKEPVTRQLIGLKLHDEKYDKQYFY
jgi:hypothetical protein